MGGAKKGQEIPGRNWTWQRRRVRENGQKARLAKTLEIISLKMPKGVYKRSPEYLQKLSERMRMHPLPENLKQGRLTHGLSRKRIYGIWRNMHSRCRYPTASRYKQYGGRGIRVCPEWKNFQSFALWAMANGYRDDLTIDRINPDQNYEPSNCRFLSKDANSKRSRKRIRWSNEEIAKMRVLFDEGMAMHAIARLLGVSRSQVGRIIKNQSRTNK